MDGGAQTTGETREEERTCKYRLKLNIQLLTKHVQLLWNVCNYFMRTKLSLTLLEATTAPTNVNDFISERKISTYFQVVGGGRKKFHSEGSKERWLR